MKINYKATSMCAFVSKKAIRLLEKEMLAKKWKLTVSLAESMLHKLYNHLWQTYHRNEAKRTFIPSRQKDSTNLVCYRCNYFAEEKIWFFVFPCLNTRAVYIEIVPNINKDACVAAISRLIAHRGELEKLINGIGTNSVGAACEFKELFSKLGRILVSKRILRIENVCGSSIQLVGLISVGYGKGL